jgi:hypothetical protein
MRNTEAAFYWIIDILEDQNIEYEISGGLAARIYGSNRELADIDIEVADADIVKIAPLVKKHIIFGPARYKDANWDIELMTLRYEGQEIDLAGIGAKIFNKQTKEWEFLAGSLRDAEMKEIFGRLVPVESRDSLVAYKTKLAREVDLEDIKQIS